MESVSKVAKSIELEKQVEVDANFDQNVLFLDKLNRPFQSELCKQLSLNPLTVDLICVVAVESKNQGAPLSPKCAKNVSK